MGKGILIILVGALAGGAILLRNAQEAAFATDRVISQHERELLAREISRSAMNSAVSEARRDFENAEDILRTNVSYQHGTFDVSAQRIDANTVQLESIGRHGSARYRIRTTLGRQVFNEGALSVSTNSASVSMGGANFRIVGIDTAPPSAPGQTGSPDTDGHAVETPSAPVRTSFLNTIGSSHASKVYGVGGTSDVSQKDPSIDLTALYSEAKANADATFSGGLQGGPVFGSPSSPVILVVEGNTQLTGQTEGYGVLVIDGNLSVASGQFTWEGLVIVRNPAGVSISMAGNADVYGTLVVLGESLDFSMSGNAKIHYSSHAVLRMAPRLSGLDRVVVLDQWVANVPE